MAARLAEEWFAICGGCEVTILDIDRMKVRLCSTRLPYFSATLI